MELSSRTCSHTCNRKRSNKLTLGTWLMIALLPKCPLCLLSYSTAISLCGGKTIFADTVGWTSYIPLILAFILIATFLYNYKGKKTLIAIGIALLGCLAILYGEYVVKTQGAYYIGVATLFTACWFNGSFSFFLKRFNNYKTI